MLKEWGDTVYRGRKFIWSIVITYEVWILTAKSNQENSERPERLAYNKYSEIFR